MICGQHRCGNIASTGFAWPGQNPKPVCAPCYNRAAAISRALGFTLVTVSLEEIEQEIAKDSIERLKGMDHG